MLEAMRRGTQTWVAKIFFGLLIASFAIWGVADVFTGWGRGSVATIAGTNITAEEYTREFQRELETFSREANQKLTAEQGKALGLDRRVISQLLGGASIEAHAKELGLDLSDATLAEMLQADPNLKDAAGKFSKDAFLDRLRQLGLSERGFFNLYRKDELRTMMLGSFVKGLVVPKPMLDMLYAYNNEKRTVEWLTIDADKVITIPAVDDTKLKERYEAEKSRYMTPEYRKFQIVTLSAGDLKAQMTVTDEEIEKSYAATKDSYDTPEQRRVQQIALKDKVTADDALKTLRDGSKTFADIAKASGAKDTDVDLGLITQKALIDKKIADAAFALEKDKFSDVIEGRFATVILRVTQIEPGTTQTLAGVKGEVRDKLALEKAKQILQQKHDEVEDARSAGKTLKEAAEQLKLPFQDIAGADRQGLGPDGKPVITSPDATKIMADVFAPDASSLDQGIELPSGAYAWITLAGTDAPKQKTFEEVKAEVKDDYTGFERQRLVTELANKLIERINAGEPMSAIEAAAGAKPEISEPFTRTTLPQGLSESVVAQAFVLAEGRAGSAQTTDRGSRTIFKVKAITPAPAPAKDQIEKLTAELQTDYTSQLLNEYAETLKIRYKASVNEIELKRALGTTEQ
jgi:peptidyl-prolyl cis-trans isomerase D